MPRHSLSAVFSIAPHRYSILSDGKTGVRKGADLSCGGIAAEGPTRGAKETFLLRIGGRDAVVAASTSKVLMQLWPPMAVKEIPVAAKIADVLALVAAEDAKDVAAAIRGSPVDAGI